MNMALGSLLLFTSLSALGYNDGIVAANGEVIAAQAEPAPSASLAVWVKGKGEQLVHRAAIGEWGPVGLICGLKRQLREGHNQNPENGLNPDMNIDGIKWPVATSAVRFNLAQ